MMQSPMRSGLGRFSESEQQLFEHYLKPRVFEKNQLIAAAGHISKSVYYIQSGACYQFRTGDFEEKIIELHLPGEWVVDHHSLIYQQPSGQALKAFERSELLELPLKSIHELIGRSQAFLQLSKIFAAPRERTYMFDAHFTPAQKYQYINRVKPLIAQVFPVKMIASYLKIAPETLSRVRADF